MAFSDFYDYFLEDYDPELRDAHGKAKGKSHSNGPNTNNCYQAKNKLNCAKWCAFKGLEKNSSSKSRKLCSGQQPADCNWEECPDKDKPVIWQG